MQTNKQQLTQQQLVLKHLGFYYGKIDGIWGPASIEAKRMFEQDKRFKPGYPNGGLPFAEIVDLPKGLEWKHHPIGPMLHVDGMDQTKQVPVTQPILTKKKQTQSMPVVNEQQIEVKPLGE